MFSEKAFQKWVSQRGAAEERERAQIRAQLAEEMDAAVAEGVARREAEAGRQAALRDTRHAKARQHIAEQERAIAEDGAAEAGRRAAIRAGVERDVAAWERQAR